MERIVRTWGLWRESPRLPLRHRRFLGLSLILALPVLLLLGGGGALLGPSGACVGDRLLGALAVLAGLVSATLSVLHLARPVIDDGER